MKSKLFIFLKKQKLKKKTIYKKRWTSNLQIRSPPSIMIDEWWRSNLDIGLHQHLQPFLQLLIFNLCYSSLICSIFFFFLPFSIFSRISSLLTIFKTRSTLLSRPLRTRNNGFSACQALFVATTLLVGSSRSRRARIDHPSSFSLSKTASNRLRPFWWFTGSVSARFHFVEWLILWVLEGFA